MVITSIVIPSERFTRELKIVVCSKITRISRNVGIWLTAYLDVHVCAVLGWQRSMFIALTLANDWLWPPCYNHLYRLRLLCCHPSTDHCLHRLAKFARVFHCTCEDVIVFLFQIQNLISPSFPSTPIYCKCIEISAISIVHPSKWGIWHMAGTVDSRFLLSLISK